MEKMVMNSYQKSYTAFMESVCKQFNRSDMLPALKEGFKAYVEAISNDNTLSDDGKIRVCYNGLHIRVGVDDLLQGLLRIYSHNGSFWCFDQLGFDFDYIQRHAPGSRGDPDKIIQGLGEDVVRQALQRVINNPDDFSEFLKKVVAWTPARDRAYAEALRNRAEADAEDLRNKGYAVEVAVSKHGLPVTVYFAKKSDNPRCYGSGVPDTDAGGYASEMRMFLMDCDAGFKVYAEYREGYPVNLKECAKRLSEKVGALTISDFKQVDSNYTAPGADWKIIGSGKYGRQAVSYKLRLIRGLTGDEFYHNA